MSEQQHEMILEKTRHSGEEEWCCPTCGRRILINWEPEFNRTILEAGDSYASHSGGKGGLRIGSLQAKAAAPSPHKDPQPRNEDPRLLPWLAWLKKSDFDNLWNDQP